MELAFTTPAAGLTRAFGQLLVLIVLLANLFVHPLLTLILLLASFALLFFYGCPRLAFWLVILLTPVETIGPISFNTAKVAKLALTGIAAIMLLADSFVSGSASGRNPYRWPFALALVAGIPASILAPSPLMSFGGLASLLIFVLFYAAVRRDQEIVARGQLLMKIILAGALLSSLLCLYQLTHGYSGFWASAEQQSVEAEQSYSTLWPLLSRASAAFNGPNAAGAFLAMGVIVACVHALLFRRWRAGYILAGILCIAGVLATFSRGALLGAIGGSVFALWAMGALSRGRVTALIIALIFLAGCAMVNDQVKGYFRLGADIASASPTRIDAWHAARVIVGRNPVFGIGFYEFHALSQGIIGSTDTPVHPHNGLLKALVEEGPVGGIAYLLFIGTFLKASLRSLRRAERRHDRWILASIAGIGTSLFIQELFDAGFAFGSSSLAILFAGLLAVQASMYSRNAQGCAKHAELHPGNITS